VGLKDVVFLKLEAPLFGLEGDSITIAHLPLVARSCADERRRPISVNLRNLREAFLLPGFSQVNSQWSIVNHHGEFSSGAGTRPAGQRQNTLIESDV
jgi:hypothetical protein